MSITYISTFVHVIFTISMHYTANREATVDHAVGCDVFAVFDENHLQDVSEDSVQFQNMQQFQGAAGSSESFSSSHPLTQDQDREMNLRIIALLAATSSLLAVHGVATSSREDQGCSQVQTEEQAALGRAATMPAEPLVTGPDMRDPRCAGAPCMGQHQVAPPGRGSPGIQCQRIVGRQRCLLRLSYTPAFGTHALCRKAAPLPTDTAAMIQAVAKQCGLQRQAERPQRSSGCCREIGHGQGGEDQSSEGHIGQADDPQSGHQGGDQPERSCHEFCNSYSGGGQRHECHSRAEIPQSRDDSRGPGVLRPHREVRTKPSSQSLMDTDAGASKRQRHKMQNVDISVDSSLNAVEYKDSEMFQNDIIPSYDLALDKEAACMTDAVFDKPFPAEYEMLNNVVAFHQDEMEECFNFTPDPNDKTSLDLMEPCCEPDSLLSEVMNKSGGRAARVDLHNGFDLMTEEGTTLAIDFINKHKPKLSMKEHQKD